MKSRLTGECKDYIIKFILGEENERFAKYVHYGLPPVLDEEGVYIVESGFFSDDVYLSDMSLPKDCFSDDDNNPVFYGRNVTNNYNNMVVTYADYIASTFFLISRYEEYIDRENRDEHGRVVGRQTLLYKSGHLDDPIVEMYGRTLREYLRECGISVLEPTVGFAKVVLTHDIDNPWLVNKDPLSMLKTTTKSLLGITLNNNKIYRKNLLKIIFLNEKDPYDTFDWFVNEDIMHCKNHSEMIESLYFLMTCKKGKNDSGYIRERKRTKELVESILKTNSQMGLHISYRGGQFPEIIEKECQAFEKIVGVRPDKSRHHYLRCCEPEHMHYLIDSGITDDFSCCFADGAGFRLGTCRPVRWIDPDKVELTDLVLHPLFATERKLLDPNYMNLSLEDAKEYIEKQIDKIWSYHGEVVVLFHNTSISGKEGKPFRELYTHMIKHINNRCDNQRDSTEREYQDYI